MYKELVPIGVRSSMKFDAAVSELRAIDATSFLDFSPLQMTYNKILVAFEAIVAEQVQLKSDNESLKKEVEHLKKGSGEETIKELMADLRDANRRIVELEKRVGSAETVLKEKAEASAVDKNTEDIADLAKKLSTLIPSINGVQKRANELAKEVQEVQTESRAMCGSLSKEVRAIHEAMATKGDLVVMSDSIRGVEDKMEAAAKQVNVVSGIVQQVAATLDERFALKADKKDLDEKLSR